MTIHCKQDFQYCPFITMTKFCSLGKKYEGCGGLSNILSEECGIFMESGKVGKHFKIGCIEGSLCLSSCFVGWVGHCGEGIA